MKISLKSFIIIICVAIIGVIAYQFYWLNSLYDSIKQEMNIKIQEAMRSTDLLEMRLRLSCLEQQDQSNKLVALIGFEYNMDVLSTFFGVTQHYKGKHPQNISPYSDTINSENLGILQSGESMNTIMLNGIHRSIDNLMLPDVHRYDSLLKKEFLFFGIEKKFYVELVNTSSDSIVGSSEGDKVFVSKSSMKSYDYFFGNRNEHIYRLWIDNPNTIVIWQMSGILMASFVILLLLAWLFYFLTRTIWKQKTLEEMKNDFINNMTHELKTPLSVSYAAVDSLLVTEKANNKEHRDKYLTIAKNQIKHLSGLAEQILSMSHDSRQNVELNPEKIELKNMIESIFRQQNLTATKQIEFEVQISPNDLTVNFDRMHLANILNNMIENSIKYSESSVKIRIVAHLVNENKVVIKVEDNGLGIESEKQKYIFEKFYRVPTGDKHNVKGHGLGLFYVKETLERAGGSISIKSRYSRGSTFTIHLSH